MDKKNSCQIQNKELEVEEWLRLVHEGACCAADDPHSEEKQQFLARLKKQEENQKKN